MQKSTLFKSTAIALPIVLLASFGVSAAYAAQITGTTSGSSITATAAQEGGMGHGRGGMRGMMGGANDANHTAMEAAIAANDFAKFQTLSAKSPFRAITTQAQFDSLVKAHALIKSAHFDSRAYTVSEVWEAYNAVLWRQKDASKNSVQMVARALYSHGKLQNKKTPELHDMIVEAGQNWNNYPTDCKRGAFVVRGENGWKIDKDGPILSQDKGYFFKFVPQMDSYQMPPEAVNVE
jgi:hypothetical protein